MKKYLLYFLTFLLAILLSGCQTVQSTGASAYENSAAVMNGEIPSELYECYFTDETLGLSSNETLPIATKRIYPSRSKIEKYAKITEITVNGKAYSCRYLDSIYLNTPYRLHAYFLENNGVIWSEVLVRDDMSIVEWVRCDFFKWGNMPNVMTFEQAEKLAIGYASEVIDVGEYGYETSVELVTPREGEPYECYKFSFRNTSNDLFERDVVQFTISAKGPLIRAYIGQIDVYDTFPDNLIDEEKLEDTLMFYLEKIYPLYFNKALNDQYEFLERDLLYTPEGAWVLRYRFALLGEGIRHGVELTVVLKDAPVLDDASLEAS